MSEWLEEEFERIEQARLLVDEFWMVNSGCDLPAMASP
jgi:hypothetical protein